MRLPMKPSHTRDTTAILPMRRETLINVASTSGAVAAPRTTSTSFMTFAGLKKCMPATSCGRRVACGDPVDVERGRVGREDRAGLRHAVERGEHLLLDRHVLEHRFDDEVGGRRRRRRRASAAKRGSAGPPRRARACLSRPRLRGSRGRQPRPCRAPAGSSRAARRGCPAARNASAMPVPIVPAPMIATRSTARGRVSRASRRCARRRVRRRRRDAAPATSGDCMSRVKSSRSMASPSSNGFVTAAATRIDATKRRRVVVRAGDERLARCARAALRHSASATVEVAQRAGAAGLRRSRGARTRSRPSSGVAVDDGIEQRRAWRARAARERRSRHDHVERGLHADEARQALRAAGARQEAELHLRQRDGRGRRGDAEVAAERELEAAAHRRAADRRDDRLRAALDRPRSRVRSVGSAIDFGVSNSRMSAPAENILPAPVRTMASTASSAFARSTAATIAVRSAWPRPFTGGLSSVTTATPSRTAYAASLMAVAVARITMGTIVGKPLRPTP